MRRVGVLTLAIFLLTGGCETLQQLTKSSADAPETIAAPDEEGEVERFVLGPLPEAALPEKKCGMVLWTLEGKRPSAIFRFVSDKDAEMNLGGRLVKFKRVNFAGASDFGVFEQQAFRSEDGVEVEINARFGLGFSGGAYLERGVIKLRDNEGWSMVAPAAGVAGCRN